MGRLSRRKLLSGATAAGALAALKPIAVTKAQTVMPRPSRDRLEEALTRIADPVPLAWPAFLAWVRTTSGDMPPYTEKVLPEQELVDIYAYIQSVPKAPDHKTIPLLANFGS